MKVNAAGYYTIRITPEGAMLSLVPLTLGRARILYSPRMDFYQCSDSW